MTSLAPDASQRSRSDRDRKSSRDLSRLLDKPGSVIRIALWHAFPRRPEPFTCEAPHDRGAVLSTDSASGCSGVRPRWHSPRSRHSTAVRSLHPDGCSKRAVPGGRMARLGCPKERSLHAKGLTPRDLGLQFPWHPPERRSSPTRFIRRHALCLPQILLLRRINAIR